MIPDPPARPTADVERGARAVPATRIEDRGEKTVARTERVVAEDVLILDVEDVGSYTLMCTPGDELALTAGFALTEGLVRTREDILSLRRCRDDPRTVRMRLRDPARVETTGRNLIVTSSCGLCGTAHDIEEMIAGLPRVGDTLVVPVSRLWEALAQLRSRQELFRRTGGAHAAALFAADGELVAFAEDLGRHNALDKAIGQCVLAEREAVGLAAALSGRVSFELVAKCARAGLELVAAVSAPSSLALRAADCCHLTVCAFVRDTRATVYTHAHRVRSPEE